MSEGAGPDEATTIPRQTAEEMIAKAREDMQGQLQSERARSQRLEQALATAAASRGGGEPGSGARAEPELTREALQARIDSKELTPEAAGELWQDNRIDQKVERRVREEAAKIAQQLQQQQRTTTVEEQLGEYKQARPDILKDGSDDRKVLEEQYGWLLKQGYLANKQTEVLACRMAFGEAKPAAREVTNEVRETNETRGASAGGGRRRGGSAKKDPLESLGLSDRQVDYYRSRIEKRQMTEKQVIERVKRVRSNREDKPNQVLRYGSRI